MVKDNSVIIKIEKGLMIIKKDIVCIRINVFSFDLVILIGFMRSLNFCQSFY